MKLNSEKVLLIVGLTNQTNLKDGEIAELFGVSRELINSIRHGHRWSDVTGIKPKETKPTPKESISDMWEWLDTKDTDKPKKEKVPSLETTYGENKNRIRSNDYREFTPNYEQKYRRLLNELKGICINEG